MSRKLRSNLQPGTALWAGRRAQWRALGLSDEDLLKPKIAIINSSSELSSCFSHLDSISTEIKQAIRDAGAIPFEVRTAAPSDFMTSAGRHGAYILPARDLIAADIEVQVEGALLDGMICLASCDKTTPGQLMGAGRLNVPSLVVICGYQAHGVYRGEHVDIEDVFLKSGHVISGKLTVEELGGMADEAIKSPGVCAGMGTANSMHTVCEALGMALPGSAPVAALSPKMFAQARAAGTRIVEMVEQDLKPRDIITPASVRNAVLLVLALSGSINCVKHLQAIATESGLDVDVYQLFADWGARIPLLAAIRPTGHGLIEDLERAGGTMAVLKRLERFLDTDVMTVSGRTLGEELQDVTVADESVIRTVDNPISTRPTLVVMRGSLLPGGGIVRQGGEGERMLRFRGPANIFHSRDEALEAVRAGKVQAGEVVVLRGLGVIGGPGMALTTAVAFALDGAGLIDQVAMITEGQLSGLVNEGLIVGEASPEAAAGGPLGWLENGDMIAIDVQARTVDFELDEATLSARQQDGRRFGASGERGWLAVYQRTVRPVHEGAVLAGGPPGGRSQSD